MTRKCSLVCVCGWTCVQLKVLFHLVPLELNLMSYIYRYIFNSIFCTYTRALIRPSVSLFYFLMQFRNSLIRLYGALARSDLESQFDEACNRFYIYSMEEHFCSQHYISTLTPIIEGFDAQFCARYDLATCCFIILLMRCDACACVRIEFGRIRK